VVEVHLMFVLQSRQLSRIESLLLEEEVAPETVRTQHAGVMAVQAAVRREFRCRAQPSSITEQLDKAAPNRRVMRLVLVQIRVATTCVAAEVVAIGAERLEATVPVVVAVLPI
tara:strand:+ start:459 stop:797 length:339 start_codon:yes stop_codon:yes gene_type:complete